MPIVPPRAPASSPLRRHTGLRALVAGAACVLLLASCGAGNGAADGNSATPRLLARAGAPGASATAADYTPLLQRIYLAYFGRPADPAGLAYFAAGFVQGGVPTDLAAMVSAHPDNPTFKSIIDSFGTSAESQALYPGDNGAFISAIYANLFNRTADVAGKAYWVDLLDRGRMTRGAAAIAVLGGAQSTDRTLIDRKAQVAANFTAALDTAARSNSYDGLAANALVRALLARVALDTDVAAFQSAIDASIATLLQGPSAPGVYPMAGSLGGPGTLDGAANAARFEFSADGGGAVADAAGNRYFTDPVYGLIRKMTPAGQVSTVAGIAGNPNDAVNLDGPAAQARFSRLSGITVDAAGNLFVISGALIRRVSPAGDVTTFAGNGFAGFADGVGTAAKFQGPLGICSDPAGNLYVADTQNHVIRKITPQAVVTVVAGAPSFDGGYVDGAAATARFRSPAGITIDAQGTLFVVEKNNRQVRRISVDGIVSTVAGAAQQSSVVLDGIGKDARFANPTGIAALGVDTVYVIDAGTVRRISGANGAAAVVATIAGRTGASADVDGAGADARFAFTTAIGADGAGALMVTSGAAVHRVLPDGATSTLAGLTPAFGSVDGMASRARFGLIGNGGALAGAPDGGVYVADDANGTVRLVTAGRTVSTVAGLAGVRKVVDGAAADARFKNLRGVARDSAGALYVSDDAVIRKIAADGTVSTLAGRAGVHGSPDGVGAAALFGVPNGIVVDAAGTVYVLDYHGLLNLVRKITPAGVVSTPFVNGVGCYAEQLAMDGDGNLYVPCVDEPVVRKITPAGVVSVFAGKPFADTPLDGSSGVAAFEQATGIVYDAQQKRLLVMDAFAGLLLAVSLDGTVSTVAGIPRATGAGAASGLPGTLPQGWGIASLGGRRYAIAADAGVVEVILP